MHMFCVTEIWIQVNDSMIIFESIHTWYKFAFLFFYHWLSNLKCPITEMQMHVFVNVNLHVNCIHEYKTKRSYLFERKKSCWCSYASSFKHWRKYLTMYLSMESSRWFFSEEIKILSHPIYIIGISRCKGFNRIWSFSNICYFN